MAGVAARTPAPAAGPLALPTHGVPLPGSIAVGPLRKVHPRRALRARSEGENSQGSAQNLLARSGMGSTEDEPQEIVPAPVAPVAASPLAPRRVILAAMGAAIPAGVAALGSGSGLFPLSLALADAETSPDSGPALADALEASADAPAAVEVPAVADAPAAPDAPAVADVPAPAPAPAQDFCSPLSASFPADTRVQVQVDPINAYSYAFPESLPLPPGTAPLNVATIGTPSEFKPAWVLTRPPERYSSAAPLSPDARLRIVSERLFVAKGAVLSVAISPPNSTFLQLPPPAVPQLDAGSASSGSGQGGLGVWTPVNVSRSVLADRTSPRMTTTQRLQETVVGGTSSKDYCGTRYYYYEFLNARSPTTFTTSKTTEVFRHSVAATAEREGYLYTITASCLDGDWATLGPVLTACVNSFRLLPPTNQYVPPYKDPWRFW